MSKTRMYHRLPIEAYTSQDWFAREMEQIFSKTWAYAGLMEDVAEPGQYITVQAGLNNIFIIMGRDRRLRAFHNVCRHRGTQLIRAVGKTQKALTCLYHDWTYDLEGNLVSVPDEATEFPNGIDKSCLGLKPAAIDIWRGMLFVHPDPNSTSIMSWFGEIEPHLGPHNVAELVEYPQARQTYDIKANWKIVVENYIDVYHLSHLHANTLAMYDHSKAEFGFVGPHYAFWEPPSADYASNQAGKLPSPSVVPADVTGVWVPMLFPGIGLCESESDWSIFVVTPLAPDLTRVENRTKVANLSDWAFAKQAARSARFWSGFARGKYEHESGDDGDDPMTSGDFTSEDVYACEQQQKSLQSPYLEIGPAAVGEAPIINHQQVVLDFLEGRR